MGEAIEHVHVGSSCLQAPTDAGAWPLNTTDTQRRGWRVNMQAEPGPSMLNILGRKPSYVGQRSQAPQYQIFWETAAQPGPLI